MKKLLIAAALGATTLAGVASVAQPAPPPPATKLRGYMNRDGVITRDEFLARAAERFDRMDTNRDGRIDRVERQASRAEMRDARHARHMGQTPPPAPGQ